MQCAHVSQGEFPLATIVWITSNIVVHLVCDEFKLMSCCLTCLFNDYVRHGELLELGLLTAFSQWYTSLDDDSDERCCFEWHVPIVNRRFESEKVCTLILSYASFDYNLLLLKFHKIGVALKLIGLREVTRWLLLEIKFVSFKLAGVNDIAEARVRYRCAE